MSYSIFNRRFLLWLAAAATMNLAGCGETAPVATQSPARATPAPRSADEAGAPLKVPAEEAATAGIKVAVIRPQEIRERISVTATIQANQDRLARIAPRVAGKIVAVGAKLGDRVRTGQSLAQLDSIEVGAARSSYAQARSDLDLARANLARAEKLFADQIIPQKDYLRSRAEFQKAEAISRAADEKLRILGVAAHAHRAGDSASVFSVTAPFPGTVTAKDAVLGELARPDKPLFTVADLSTVWIETNLFEKDLSSVRLGAEALITVAAYPGESFQGKVTYISSTMDKETRTIRARIEVPNFEERLRLEMFATAEILTPEIRSAMLVPSDAIVLIQGQPTVFVEAEGGYLPRAVEPGQTLRSGTALKAGVNPGERVVVGGAYALKARLLKSQIGDAH